MRFSLLGKCSVHSALVICGLSVVCLYSPPASAQTCTTGISPCTIPSSTAGYVGEPGTASYTYGTINNTGDIQLQAGGASNQNTVLYVEAGASNATTTLTGSGTLTLSTSGGTGTAIIADGTFAGNNSLVNLNNAIQGFGNIGQGSDLVLSNSGTIDANVSGQTLLLNGLPITNSVDSTGGLLEATNGGFLVMQNAINNLNANITASGAGSTVYVGSSIQGGTIGSSAGGVFQSYVGGSAVLDGSTQGQLTLATGTTFTGVAGTVTGIVGAIDNQGNIQIVAGGDHNATLGIGLGYGNGATLTGGGTITLSSSDGTGTAIISDATFAGGNNLTNGSATSAHTIQGYGQIGNGSDLTLTNAALGIVDANVSGSTLTLNGGNVTNTGLLEATHGGNLQITTTINNLNGTISTDSGLGSTVSVGSTIQGGTLTGTLQTNSAATLDGSTQGTLTLSSGSTYTGGAGTNTSIVGAIDNQGNIQIVAGDSHNATLGIGLGYGNGATLTGGGAITLSSSDGTGTAIISDATFAGGNKLTNGSATSAHTIQGYGQIGNTSDLTLTNAALGIVDANVSGSTLTLNGGNVTNTGLLEATNGGNLQITTTINNLNGTISTDSGLHSTVSVSSTIQGGTLTGTLQTNSAATLDGSTQGTLTLSSGSTYTGGPGTNTGIVGAIDNQGSIQIVAGDSHNATLEIGLGYGNGATLTGGGAITLSSSDGTGTAIISDATFAGGNKLTNGSATSAHTIQGYGQIGNTSDLTLTNAALGIVDANVSGSTLTLNGGNVTNTGLLEATNGGNLQITTTINNLNGTISTDSGLHSTVSVSSTIQGGTLTGTLQTNGAATLDGSTQGTLTLSTGSTYTAGVGTTTSILGTIQNQGNIQIAAGSGRNAVVSVGGGGSGNNTTLTGGGTITLSGGAGATAIIEDGTFAGGNSLTNSTNTIQGYGSIGSTGDLKVVNGAGGMLLANVAGQTLSVSGTGGLTNNGTMQANAGSTLAATQGFTNFSGSTLTGGTYNVYGTGSSAGTIQIDALGSTGGEILTNDATILLDGLNSNFFDGAGKDALSDLDDNEGTLAILDGRNFTTLGGFDNTGTLALGSTDTFTVDGTFDPPAGDVIFDISGTGVNGFLDITGAADFGGTLTLDATNGFTLAAGDMFYLAEYNSLGSEFNPADINTAGLDLAPGLTAQVLYNQGAGDNEVELLIGGNASAAPEPSTWLLFAGGLATFAAFRMARRRRTMTEVSAKDSCA